LDDVGGRLSAGTVRHELGRSHAPG